MDLAAELDALETSKGPEPMTCKFWRESGDDLRAAVERNVAAKGHTLITKHLKSRGYRVTTDGIRDHAAGKCPKCQISQTS